MKKQLTASEPLDHELKMKLDKFVDHCLKKYLKVCCVKLYFGVTSGYAFWVFLDSSKVVWVLETWCLLTI